MSNQLLLYYKNSCSFCHKVLDYLEAKGREVPKKDISLDYDAAMALVEVGGKRQVPCLVIDGKALYESDDIIAWFESQPT